MRFYLIIPLVVLFESPLFSATVTAINRTQGLVKIDEGSDSDIKADTKICFYSDENKKVACGIVTKSKANISYIAVKSTSQFSKIKKGMFAKPDNKSTASKTGATTSTNTTTAKHKHRNNLKLGYVASIFSPTSYNRVTYYLAKGEEATPQQTLWKNEQTAASTLRGAFVESEFGLGKALSMSVGIRYRRFSEFVGDTDYSSDITKFVSVSQTASNIGLYSDTTFVDAALTDFIFYRLAAGLDFDMSTVTFKATQKSDDGESNALANYKSSLNVVSLRVGTNFTFMIGKLGVIAPGINLLLPVAALGQSATADVTDPQAASILEGGEEAANDDLVKAIDHKKASFGAEFILATFIAF